MDKSHGILVASDKNQEWLLKWWWKRYIRHNNHPVAFVDFGMTHEMAEWCKEKGSLIPFSYSIKVSSHKKILNETQSIYGKEIINTRNFWFKKPLAFTLTPFEKTIWLDLDCEVLGSLAPLFAYKNIALAKEITNLSLYNSGVIVYKKNSSLIKKWAKESEKASEHFIGDQELLSFLIHTKKIKVDELPPEYNWRMCKGININAQIIHWVGIWGKEIIKKFGGLPSI